MARSYAQSKILTPTASQPPLHSYAPLRVVSHSIVSRTLPDSHREVRSTFRYRIVECLETRPKTNCLPYFVSSSSATLCLEGLHCRDLAVDFVDEPGGGVHGVGGEMPSSSSM